MKVKILKTGRYSTDYVTLQDWEKGDIKDIPESVAKDFVRGGLALHVHENIDDTIIVETPKSPVLETQDMNLSNLEYKELKELAESKGFQQGRGKPSKNNLIEFLRGK